MKCQFVHKQSFRFKSQFCPTNKYQKKLSIEPPSNDPDAEAYVSLDRVQKIDSTSFEKYNHIMNDTQTKQYNKLTKNMSGGRYMGTQDIKFIADNNLPFNAQQLYADRNSGTLQDCAAHRGIQEYLRDKHNHKSDQTAWNKNCEVIHTFKMSKNEKN